MDEIDALVGDTSISVLRQVRAGYDSRPDAFPQSVILCGVRDVRDYRIHSSREKSIITGGSAFNIKATSVRLGNFKQADVQQLFRQHTEETGQAFHPEVLEQVWVYTSGQPRLVNALGYETCFEMKGNQDRHIEITSEMIETARENLILRRDRLALNSQNSSKPPSTDASRKSKCSGKNRGRSHGGFPHDRLNNIVGGLEND